MKSLDVPLVFRPEKSVSGRYDPVPASPGLRLQVPAVVDDRSDKDLIGQNTELDHRDPRPIHAAERTPPEFIHDTFVRELKLAGYDSVASGDAPNRVLSIRLTRFFTAESTRYEGEVAAAVELRDQSGAVLWQGQSSGSSNRFGRSLSRENYQECFTDATLNLIAGVLNSKQFQAAMTVN